MITYLTDFECVKNRMEFKINTHKRKKRLEREKPLVIKNAPNKKEEISFLINFLEKTSICDTSLEVESIFRIYTGKLCYENSEEILHSSSLLDHLLDSSTLIDLETDIDIDFASLIEEYKIYPIPGISPLSMWKFPVLSNLFSDINYYGNNISANDYDLHTEFALNSWYNVGISNFKHITSLTGILTKDPIYFIPEFYLWRSIDIDNIVFRDKEAFNSLALLLSYLKHDKDTYKTKYIKTLKNTKKDDSNQWEIFTEDYLYYMYENMEDLNIADCIFRYKARKILKLLIDNNHLDTNKTITNKERRELFHLINKNFKKFIKDEDFKTFQTLIYFLLFKEPEFADILSRIKKVIIVPSNPSIALDSKENRRRIKKLYEIFSHHVNVVNNAALKFEEVFELIDIKDVEQTCIDTVKEFIST